MGKVYEFLDDRLRAIRQDIILQQPPPSECIPILEPIVRFYAFAAYRHCEDKGDQFDPVLNHGSLLSCLKCLMIMYDSEDHVSEDRSEMEALYLIINLGHTEALIRSLTLPKHIRWEL
ncbi:hypothetical protein AAG570_010213 [Ranatra chinensis]|uniref:SAC3/GANP/THP3 conserved domain-containing protein n=1 Tax=Ranatra chinensis TaxID=642074 RepID=A0ABD0YLW8_9HEMI